MMNEYQSMPNGLPFVKTTLKLLKQYEKVSQDFAEQDKLETTLYLNCLLGLLIVPQQHYLSGRRLLINANEEWGFDLSDIKYCGRHKSCNQADVGTANEVARHLRNSLSHHNRFEVIAGDGVNITHVCFKDFLHDGVTQTFELTVSVENLRKFVQNFFKKVFSEDELAYEI